MNLATMRESVADIAAFIATDKHGTLRHEFFRALVEQGLLDCMPFDPERPSPFPTVTDLTAVQVSLFDNWPRGKRAQGKPHRYAVTANGWTLPAKGIDFGKRNWQVKANATLFTGPELVAKIPALTKATLVNPIAASYADTLNQIAALATANDCVVGPLFSKGGKSGTHYYDQTFVVMRLDDGLPSRALLYSHGGKLELAGFVTTDASKQALKGNAAFQSRTSPDPLLANWRSR